MTWILTFLFAVLFAGVGLLALVLWYGGILWMAIFGGVTAVVMFCAVVYTAILNIKGFWYY